MTLDNDDKKWISGAVKEGVVEALEQVVGPRFDALHENFMLIRKDIEDMIIILNSSSQQKQIDRLNVVVGV